MYIYIPIWSTGHDLSAAVCNQNFLWRRANSVPLEEFLAQTDEVSAYPSPGVGSRGCWGCRGRGGDSCLGCCSSASSSSPGSGSCMVYMLTFELKMVNVTKYSIHGSYGYVCVYIYIIQSNPVESRWNPFGKSSPIHLVAGTVRKLRIEEYGEAPGGQNWSRNGWQKKTQK